ncbi:MAG: hypothetical protein H8E09_00565 [Gammaproteobacteria bacterium]|nr:hypothetical protein [Gammaproteobacteria bacterium]
MDVSINKKQSLYVYKIDNGYSCRGFQSLFDETNLLAKKLNKPECSVAQNELGTLIVHKKYQQLVKASHTVKLGTFFNANTPENICRILEKLRKNGQQIRLFYGDTITGKDWLDECDLQGFIGRSRGPLKIPLLIKPGESSGFGLLDHCIVRIIQVSNGKVLYSHHNYHHSHFEIVKLYDQGEYVVEITVDGDTHARFKNIDESYHWLAYMTGKSFVPLCT